jgi:hypothetical protein
VFSGNEATSSASCFSGIGVVSVNSDSVQNVNTSTSPQHDSARTCQEDAPQSNGNKQCRILENTPNSRQVALVEGVESCFRSLRRSSDINISVYTETDAPGALKTNSEGRSGSYAHELNQKDSSGMQVEVINYPVETSSWYYIKVEFLFYEIAWLCQIFARVM